MDHWTWCGSMWWEDVIYSVLLKSATNLILYCCWYQAVKSFQLLKIIIVSVEFKYFYKWYPFLIKIDKISIEKVWSKKSIKIPT